MFQEDGMNGKYICKGTLELTTWKKIDFESICNTITSFTPYELTSHVDVGSGSG